MSNRSKHLRARPGIMQRGVRGLFLTAVIMAITAIAGPAAAQSTDFIRGDSNDCGPDPTHGGPLDPVRKEGGAIFPEPPNLARVICANGDRVRDIALFGIVVDNPNVEHIVCTVQGFANGGLPSFPTPPPKQSLGAGPQRIDFEIPVSNQTAVLHVKCLLPGDPSGVNPNRLLGVFVSSRN